LLVLLEDELLWQAKAQVYALMPATGGEYQASADVCLYSTAVDGDLVKLNSLKDFWAIITERKKRVLKLK